MATLRSDIRTRVRDYVYEATADLITDAQLNRLVSEEVQSLPGKGIFIQDMYTTTTVDDQYDYALPTGTYKVEYVERNDGTSSLPEWNPIEGWSVYSSALWLPYRPTSTDTIRVHIQKIFTNPSDDVTSLDVPDDVCEVVVWGVVVRAYRMLIGYFRQAKNFDSISHPNSVSISQMQNWLRDATQEYSKLLKQYALPVKPKNIDLIG